MLGNLPADSFAAMVYWIFVVGLAMILIYFLEKVYQVSKKWFMSLILCPPLAIIFIKIHWEESRAACVFFSIFYLIIIFAGTISGYPMASPTQRTLAYVFLWPYYIANYALQSLG